jgi:hypothetical protein
MAILTVSDSEKSVSATLAGIKVNDPPMEQLWGSLNALNAVAPISSVGFSTLTITIVLKDARTFATTMTLGTPETFSLNTGSYKFSDVEFALIKGVAQMIVSMYFQQTLTVLSVTYI